MISEWRRHALSVSFGACWRHQKHACYWAWMGLRIVLGHTPKPSTPEEGRALLLATSGTCLRAAATLQSMADGVQNPVALVQLFHWRVPEGRDGFCSYFVACESEVNAGKLILGNIEKWKWQNPERFAKHAEFIARQTPYIVAEAGYVISEAGQS